ncbi:MAG: GAF domain-containing protein [Anaerolineales bacterium]|nr:GAF domain-containing protein [Anaerolineales bacterium]
MDSFEAPHPPTPVLADQPPAPQATTIWAAVIASVIALADGSLTTITFLNTRAWQLLVDAGGMLVVLITAIISLVLGRRGEKTRATWVLIYGLLLVMITKTISNVNTGVLIGIAGAAFISIIGFLYFPPEQATRTTILSFAAGAAAAVLDSYWPFERIISIASAGGVPASLAILAIYPLFIISRFRRFNLYTKLIMAFLAISLMPAIVIGLINYISLRNSLTAGINDNLQNAASQTAAALDAYINQNAEILNTEVQTPIFNEYLRSIAGGSVADTATSLEARETLAALGDRQHLLSYALLDANGRVVLDTQTGNIGLREQEYAYIRTPLLTSSTYISPVFIGPDGIPSIVFSAPVTDEHGYAIGVIRARYDAAALQEIVQGYTGLAGQGSYAALFDENGIYLANGLRPNRTLRSASLLEASALQQLQQDYRLPAGSPQDLSTEQMDLAAGLAAPTGEVFYITEQSEALAGHPEEEHREAGLTSPLVTRPWTVAFLIPEEVYLLPLQGQVRTTTVMAALIIVGVTIGAWFFSRQLSSPINRLAETARQVESGDLNAVAEIQTEDEVGILAGTFNSMTARLRELISSLETRVEERTLALERRAAQIQTAVDVGGVAASLRDRDQLMRQAAQLISERFGFYHVGLFLLDEAREFAVLKATNSEGGQRMLERGHRLKIGETSIVGFATRYGAPRIALDVGEDAVFFQNPDLPATRSEMCLPLIVGGQIVGALDVQSTQEAAFAEEDVTTLRVLADQIAVAIDNARLLEESQSAIEAARRAYGEISQASWQRLIREQEETIGYISAAEGDIHPAGSDTTAEFLQALTSGKPVLSDDQTTLQVPILIRGEAIGAIRLDRPEESGPWTSGDIAAAGNLADQLSTSLESARLYDETSRRAERERILGEISARMSTSMHMNTILETATAEIGRVFSDSEVVLQLSRPGSAQAGADEIETEAHEEQP